MNHSLLGATCKQLAHTFAAALVHALRQAPVSELADVLDPSTARPQRRAPAPAKPKPAKVKRATSPRRREPAAREKQPKQKAPAATKPKPRVTTTPPKEAERATAPRPPASPPESPWTVNVSDGDQREMTVEDILLAYTSGLVTAATFVWRAGMPEWVPLREVSEILGGARAKQKS